MSVCNVLRLSMAGCLIMLSFFVKRSLGVSAVMSEGNRLGVPIDGCTLWDFNCVVVVLYST